MTPSRTAIKVAAADGQGDRLGLVAGAAAAALDLRLMAGLSGSLILIPLHYQVVHHDSSLQMGPLIATQGTGAATESAKAAPPMSISSPPDFPAHAGGTR